MNSLFGRNDIEDALKRLDTLTLEEAQMAISETLKVTNRVDDKVNKVDDKVTVLIDGEQCVHLVIFAFLNMDVDRCERSKPSHTPVSKHCR